jgi:Ni,Fe-hydrogenase III small subunit
MTLRSVLRAIAHPPLATEDPGATPGAHPVLAGPLHGSLQLRHVDAGSCNGCELEVTSAFGPVYDAERFGVRLVASPRHADALLVTGPVTKNMVGPLERTFVAMPEPRIVIALGDCARDCGAFRGGYGVEGAVGDVLPVDVHIAGCPPHPEAIIEALRGLTDR